MLVPLGLRLLKQLPKRLPRRLQGRRGKTPMQYGNVIDAEQAGPSIKAAYDALMQVLAGVKQFTDTTNRELNEVCLVRHRLSQKARQAL